MIWIARILKTIIVGQKGTEIIKLYEAESFRLCTLIYHKWVAPRWKLPLTKASSVNHLVFSSDQIASARLMALYKRSPIDLTFLQWVAVSWVILVIHNSIQLLRQPLITLFADSKPPICPTLKFRAYASKLCTALRRQSFFWWYNGFGLPVHQQNSNIAFGFEASLKSFTLFRSSMNKRHDAFYNLWPGAVGCNWPIRREGRVEGVTGKIFYCKWAILVNSFVEHCWSGRWNPFEKEALCGAHNKSVHGSGSSGC